jgi:DNA polymerase III psi subunit
MKNTSVLLLSDYQRAILNEMGISSWQLVGEQSSRVKIENQPDKTVATPSKVKSKEDALAKLKQLKVQTQTTEATDSVLVTFSKSDTNLQVFTDVLIALGLENKQQKHISTNELNHYSGYPLCWTLGEKINLKHEQLITPALSELNHSDTKKQLWQQLQRVFSIENKLTK